MFDVKCSVDNSISALADLLLKLETWAAFRLLLFELLQLFLRLCHLFLWNCQIDCIATCTLWRSLLFVFVARIPHHTLLACYCLLTLVW